MIWADPFDCGSQEETIDGKLVRTVENERDLSLYYLEATIKDRTGHNEWVVRCYEVLGLFGHAPWTADKEAGRPERITRSETDAILLQACRSLEPKKAKSVTWESHIEFIAHSDVYPAVSAP